MYSTPFRCLHKPFGSFREWIGEIAYVNEDTPTRQKEMSL